MWLCRCCDVPRPEALGQIGRLEQVGDPPDPSALRSPAGRRGCASPDGLEESSGRRDRPSEPGQRQLDRPGLEQVRRLRVLAADLVADQLARVGLADRERVDHVAQPAELRDLAPDEGVSHASILAGQVADREWFRH